MNEVTNFMGDIDMEGSYLASTLVFSRNLGMKHIMPGLAQWQVLDEKRSECWRCDQHMLTIFLWTPRIGLMTSSQIADQILYYKEQMDLRRDTDVDLHTNVSNTPMIASDFTDWRYQPMQEVVRFCTDRDLSPPNFEELCVNAGLLNASSAGRLNGDEKKILNKVKREYYVDHWQEVLQELVRYKKP